MLLIRIWFEVILLARRLPCFPAILTRCGKSGNIHYELGGLKDPLNNYKEAVKNYQAFLDNATDFPRKGMVYYRIGKALTEMQKADTQNKGNANIEEAINALGNINQSMMDNPNQYADALILLGQAYEENAYFYQKAADKDLYERNLEKAAETYARVGLTNVQNKVKQATDMRNSVMQILSNQRELANVKP